ncbi:hypothetical protein WJX77_006853 [Trebouxia sp. C0004]
MELECPDGTTLPVGTGCTYGRWNLGAAADDNISREQFRLDPVDGLADVVQLQVLGRNAMVLERQLSAPSDSLAGGDHWELTDYLDQGMSSVVATGARFYVASRMETTMFKLQSVSAKANFPAGTKRPRSATAGPPAKENNQPPTAVVDTGQSQPDGPGDKACFQLLYVREIPDWANRAPGGCRLRDVVHGSMKWVLASNFMVDMTWLLSACPHLLQAHQLVIVHGERTPDRVGAMKAVAASAGLANLVVHAPPLPVQFGTYHSKAFMIEYERGLRVVVHTANLIYVDCNNKSQGLWYQDFPRKNDTSPATSEFEQELADYLKALRLPQAPAQKAEALCKQHDFSSARVHLIISRPGYHSGPALKKYGHLRVQALLARETFPAHFQGAPLVAQFSSLGSLDERWLSKEFRVSLSAGLSSAGGKLGLGAAGAKGLQLVWPTVQEIKASLEGWRGGASVPGPAKNVNKPFLQPFWHKWGGEPWGRQRAMPHIKSYTRYEGQQVAWFILASHNLSKAAWGAVQKQGTQLFIRSFELGVMFLPSLEARYRQHPNRGFSCTPQAPPAHPSAEDASTCTIVNAPPADPLAAAAATAAAGEQGDAALAQGLPAPEFWTSQAGTDDSSDTTSSSSGTSRLIMPIPYMLPPRPYSSHMSTDQPWCVDIEYSGVDSLGHNINDPVQGFYGQLQPPD